MNKSEAVNIMNEYINATNSRQPVSIDTSYIIDDNPKEFLLYWVFKRYYINLNPMRPDGIDYNSFYSLSKTTSEILFINLDTYNALEKVESIKTSYFSKILSFLK